MWSKVKFIFNLATDMLIKMDDLTLSQETVKLLNIKDLKIALADSQVYNVKICFYYL